MSPELQALVEQVRAAAAAGHGLRIAGGNTKHWLGEPAAAGVGEAEGVLSTLALRGVSSYEPSELVVSARAGTPLAELEALLAQHGQCLPFEPPHFGAGGTVGGMVAAGLAGPARASVGGVRDYVLGATVLNGRGEVLSFGGQVMKNVAGYDLARLFAGSLGVLGLIAEVSLKVLPLPAASATLRFDAVTQAQAIERLAQWQAQALPLNASAWWAGTLVLRLRGAQAAVQAACTRLGGERIPEEQTGAFWAGLRDQTDAFFTPRPGHTLWRLSLPNDVPPLELGGEPDTDGLLEWHGAQRWLHSRQPAAALHQAAAALGGHATAWRGAAAEAPRLAPLNPVLQALHTRLKAAFDPQRVFNRGRLLKDL